MHLTNEVLKVLIDVLAERLDDDLDMLSDSSLLEERESVKTAWAVKDLLENLRQEQRSRGTARGFKVTNEGGTHQFAGISNAPPEGAKNVGIGIGVEVGEPPPTQFDFMRMFAPPVKNPMAGVQFVSSRTILGLQKKVAELEKKLSAHVGEGEVRH